MKQNSINKMSAITAMLLVASIVMFSLVACSNGRSSIFDDDNGKESSSETDTTADNEVKRFDYFSADNSQYISLSHDAYASVSVDIQDVFQVDDEDVSDYIDKILFQNKKVKNNGSKVTDQPLRYGDTAYIFYKGLIDGEEFEGGSNMDDESPYGLSLGSGSFIPGFEDALIGIVPCETSLSNLYKIDLTFPETNNEEVAGKEVSFYICVSWAVQYEIPELTKTFVTETLKFETDKDDVIEAYRDYVKEYLEKEKAKEKEEAVLAEIWNKLLESATIKSYPEGEVEYFYNETISGFEQTYEYMKYYGYTFENFDEFAREYMGLKKDADWKEALRNDCKNRVAKYLIVHIIAEQENITVTEEAYEDEIKYYMDYYADYSYTRDDIIKYMGEDNLKESALNTLVMYNYVVKNAEVNLLPIEEESTAATE